MPKIVLNGKEIEFEPGQTVIEAATAHDTVVPHYCWHPALTVVASCRICQVEVHGPGPRRLVTACNTPCVDGMEVVTESAAVAKARAGNLEDLLANHPLDCPICDKAGECWLQDYAYEYGAAVGRYDFPRRKLDKRVDISEHVLLDQERCILCTRCVRFLDDYAKQPELVVTDRGERSVIETFPGRPVTSNYQGNLADICPVGALTLKEFRFRNRVWYLKGVDSVCPSCTRNCSITLDVRQNQLNRVRPRTNLDVNGYFICDEGRFGLLERYHPERRLDAVLQGGQPVTLRRGAEWMAKRLQEIAAAGGDLLVLASPQRNTNEELLLLQRAFAGADGPVADHVTLAFLTVEDEGADGILHTGQRAGNLNGLRARGFVELDRATLLERLGRARAAWILDDRITTAGVHLELLAVQGVTSPLADKAAVVLPGSTVGEKEGTLTNVDDRMQRVLPALTPPAGVPGDFRCILAVGEALGVAGLPGTPGEAFIAIADAAGHTELTLAGLPANGVLLAAPEESKA